MFSSIWSSSIKLKKHEWKLQNLFPLHLGEKTAVSIHWQRVIGVIVLFSHETKGFVGFDYFHLDSDIVKYQKAPNSFLEWSQNIIFFTSKLLTSSCYTEKETAAKEHLLFFFLLEPVSIKWLFSNLLEKKICPFHKIQIIEKVCKIAMKQVK